MRSEFGRQKSQNSTSIGRPRWITLACPRAGVFTHGSSAREQRRGDRVDGRALSAPADARQAPPGGQPMEPTISSWISRFSSTAYSIGSSFVTGSMKPLTIIAAASSSVKPREPM